MEPEDIDPQECVKIVRKSMKVLAAEDPDFYAALRRGCDNYESGEETAELPYLMQLARYPVSVRQFLFDPQYLGKKVEEIYPEVLKELEKINNAHGLRVINPYTEALFTGGIGSAKSTTALYTVAYQIYVLSCFRNPHKTFGLDTASEIMFIFQSVTAEVAKVVDYARFYSTITASPYFRTVFPYNRRIKSELSFPFRILVRPVGSDHGTIGQNVMGGLIDELNFMAVTEQSKKTRDKGVYDQAKTIYNSIARRRKTRFVEFGHSPGILCLVSSKRYPGEFTDQKIEEAKTDPTIYIYDKRVWEVKPAGTYSNQRFRVFVGDLQRKAKILGTNEKVKEADKLKVIEVPIEHRREFELDPIGSLRDIAGVSTLARYPYFQNIEMVSACFGKVTSILSLDETDFESSQLQIIKSRFKNTKWTRWAHVDLGLTSDSAGVACGYVKEYVVTVEGYLMPVIVFDFIVRIKPPPNDEIKFFKIRRLLGLVRDLGIPLKYISFDSFQSVDSIQLLRQASFTTGQQSMDKTVGPYEIAKTAFYHDRVRMPKHQHCLNEFASLEKDAKSGKIDHPPNGSKDCSDAVAGVITGLTTMKAIWMEHDVLPNPAVVQQVSKMRAEEKKRKEIEEGGTGDQAPEVEGLGTMTEEAA